MMLPQQHPIPGALSGERRFSTYPEYRHSGVAWLPTIPTDWSIKRLRYALSLPTKSESRLLPRDHAVSFVPMEAVGEYGGLSLDQTRPIEDVLNGYTYFRDGDVLVAKITPCFENGKGALAQKLEGGIGFGTTELHVLRPGRDLDGRFLFYLTVGEDFRKLGTAEMYGAGGQKRVPESFIRELRHPIPPLGEQQTIADFLDHETTHIDALIVKKLRLIELLLEKRSALISRLVTKGLNPDAPMKQSGVDWLGQIPEHWVVKKLRYLCSIQTGDKDTVDAVDKGIYPFFVRSQTIERINSFTFDCEAVLTAGDGVGVGKVFHHYKGQFDVHQRVYVMSAFRGVVGRFLYYFLKEQFYKVALEGNAKSTVDSLRRPMFTGFPISLPLIDEQVRLVNHLDTQTSKLDRLIPEVETAICGLREYRSALISAAVTGRIDVRNCLENTPCQ